MINNFSRIFALSKGNNNPHDTNKSSLKCWHSFRMDNYTHSVGKTEETTIKRIEQVTMFAASIQTIPEQVFKITLTM